MYELLILGTLMSRSMSGYKLRKILGNSLVPRREISNGVMYPLLRKLEDDGYIIQSADPDSARGEKTAHITDRGREHFQEMMSAPVVADGKRESVYRFKIRAFGEIQPDVQIEILDAFDDTVQQDLDEFIRSRNHLQQKLHVDESRAEHLEWTIQTLDLSIALSETKQRWIAGCRRKIALAVKKEN